MSAMERVTCVDCGRKVPAYVPRGGDGSALFARKHKGADGKPCPRRAVLYEYEED